MLRRVLLTCAVGAIAATAPLAAQSHGPELSVGIGALVYQHETGFNQTQVQVGLQRVNLGFYLSPSIALEPSVLFLYAHASDGTSSSSTDIMLQLGLPIYLQKDWGHTGVFIAPMVGLTSHSNGNSESQFSFGGSLGTKMRVSDMVSLKLAAVVMHALEKTSDNLPANTQVAGTFGVSVFFK